MKPAKKHNNDSNNNRKQISEDSEDTSSSKIKSYFKSVPKSFVVTDQLKKNHAVSSSKDFYIRILKERLQGKVFLNIFCGCFSY